MQSQIIYLIILSAATGVGGLALGGLLALLLKRESPKGTSLLLSFTAGLMLCIVCFDMIPEAMEQVEQLYVPPVCLVLGFLITFALNAWIDKSMHHEDHHHPHHCACGHHDLKTAGFVLAAAVALHNMPVGMAVGTTVAVQGVCYASLLTAVTIAFHNIPEGMSIAVPLLHDGSKPFSAIGVAALSGVPTVLGYFIGNQTPMALSVAMSIAGGAMLYVVFFELLPEAYQQWRSKWAILATVVGFALGLLLISSHLHIHVHPL